jgi:hypothetical protein
VLVLVGEQHLVDEAAGEQWVVGVEIHLVEDLERPFANLGQIGADLVGGQDRQLATDLARLLDRVVEVSQLTAQRLAPTDPADEPELLEVGDVPEVPDQRAEDRRVDAVELLVAERLDQLQGALPRLGQPLGDSFPSCPESRFESDAESLRDSVGCRGHADRGCKRAGRRRGLRPR